MPVYKPPQRFDFEKPDGWKSWRQTFLAFRKLTKLDTETPDMQVCSLKYCMGMPESENIFDTFTGLPAQITFDSVLTNYDSYFQPRKNLVHLRAQFDKRVQNREETVEQFVRALHVLAKDCEFSSAEERVRDRFVVGLNDDEISDKLQLEIDLTLKKAIDIARQFEQIKNQKKERQQSVNIDAARQTNPVRKFRSQGQPTTSASKCNYCGYANHMNKTKCPAYGKRCKACNMLNHFAQVCRQSKDKHSSIHNVEVEEQTTEHFLGSVASDNECNKWWLTATLQGTEIKFKVDTGADVDVISEVTYRELSSRPELSPCRTTLISPGGKIDCLGCFITNIQYKEHNIESTVYVMKNNVTDNLLSLGTAKKMGVVNFLASIDKNLFGEIGFWNMDPVKIHLVDDAKPWSVYAARRIAIPLMEPVKKELLKMEKSGVISRVTHPTDWCAPIVPVVKSQIKGQPATVRICVDLKHLNQQVKRERYEMPVFEELAAKLSGAKVFSKLDAANGFWQVPLAKESRELTTFITPFGRFFFNRLCFGINLAPELYQRKMAELLEGLSNVVVYMDDILCYGKDLSEHDLALEEVTRRIKKAGIKLNKNKCEFRKPEIKFLGYVLTKNGITVDPRKVSAIREMEPPENVTELKRFLGMVHFLHRHLPNMCNISRPLNELLKKDVQWNWLSEQQKSFQEVKELVTNAPVLSYFQTDLPVVVAADASSYGLGGVLMQEKGGILQPVAYCSRTLTSCETRYAQIEKETLALVYACEQFYKYVYGLPHFRLQTDHRPLVPLINSTRLDEAPLRCQRLLMRLMKYNLTAEYIPGPKLVIPDMLSRKPQINSRDNAVELHDDIKRYIDCVSFPASSKLLDELKRETQEDYSLKSVYEYTLSGWPAQIPEDIKDYASAIQHLSILDGLLLFNERLVIPRSKRNAILERLHAGHLGYEKCRMRAMESVWWPGIAGDLRAYIEGCTFCLEHRPRQHREPLIVTTMPGGPWEEIAADLFEMEGKHYIVMVDYFSRFIEIKGLPDLSAKTTIERIKSVFAQHGIPLKVRTDNGPQFVAREFREFANAYDFLHITSSPRYPQSNGEAERAVQTAKRILQQEDPHLALLTYRATATHVTKVSPAKLLNNRTLRTTLPTIKNKDSLISEDREFAIRNDAKSKTNYKKFYNRRYRVRELPDLRAGTQVTIQRTPDEKWKGDYIVKTKVGPRSYEVQNGNSTLVRNRRHIMIKHHDNKPSVDLDIPVNDSTPVIPPSSSPKREISLPSKVTDQEPSSIVIPEPPEPPSSMITTRSGRVVKPVKRLCL